MLIKITFTNSLKIYIIAFTVHASDCSVARSLVIQSSRSSSWSSIESSGNSSVSSHKDLQAWTVAQQMERIQGIVDQKDVALMQIARERADIAQVKRDISLQLQSEEVSNNKFVFIALWIQECDAANRETDLWRQQYHLSAERNQAMMKLDSLKSL